MRAICAVLFVSSLISAATAQQTDPVERLKEGFAPPKPPPIEQVRDETMANLLGVFNQAHGPLPKELAPRIRALLAETIAVGVSFDRIPKHPWDKEQHHFQVNSIKIESAPVGPGLVLLRVSGTLGATTAQQLGSDGEFTIVPVLLQFSKDRTRLEIGKGKAAAAPKIFEIVNERMAGADHAMLGFLNQRDGSWAMYRDAISGNPLDQFVTVKIDEKTLIDLEKKQSTDRSVSDAKSKKTAAADEAARAEAAEVKADADAVRQQAAMKEHAKKMALLTAQFRKWNALGGAKASEAKIAGYENATVTLQKRDGKSVRVRASRLNKADREYLDQWLAKAQIEK